MPKCPVCLALYLAMIGIAGLSAKQMWWGTFGICVVFAAVLYLLILRCIEKLRRAKQFVP